MKYLEVIANPSSRPTIEAIGEKVKAHDFRVGLEGDDGQLPMRLLVADDRVQETLDLLQHVLGAQPSARILVMPIETAIPKLDEDKASREHSAMAAREALYANVKKGTRLDANYLVLVFLSTVVAAIGLIEDNVAVVIGAMVIAPLLSPNLALSLGTALGDLALVRESIRTLAVGVGTAALLAIVIGLLWPGELDSQELHARTFAGLDSVALALASGAAAALSLTTGLSSVLVGVMVAVALLPPTATMGLMIGQGRFELALGAGLLLAINIVSVNLASKIVFAVKNIRPRTWLEKEKARGAMRIYIVGWLIALVILLFAALAQKSLMAN